MWANYVLYFGLFMLSICFILFIVVTAIELRETNGHNPVPDYDFDINEHQNYWEADSR